MISLKNPIYECNHAKVDVGVKKSHRVKIRRYGKSDLNGKDIKKDR